MPPARITRINLTCSTSTLEKMGCFMSSDLFAAFPFEVAAVLRDLVSLYSQASFRGTPAEVLAVPPRFVRDERKGIEPLTAIGLWIVCVEHDAAELAPYFPPHKFWLLREEHARALRRSWAHVHAVLLEELEELDNEDEEEEEEDETAAEELGEAAEETAKIVDFASVASAADASGPQDAPPVVQHRATNSRGVRTGRSSKT